MATVDKKKRNRNAGSHPSYKKKGMSEASRQKKLAYDKAYHATKERKAYRSSLNKANRGNPKSKVGDKKDMSHTKKGKLVLEKQKLNRKRNGANGKSTKK